MKPSWHHLLVAISLAWGSAQAGHIWPDGKAVEQAEYPNSAAAVIAFEGTTSITATFAITTKGNGTLELPGVLARVYDSHDDGITYRGSLLRCEWRQAAANVIELEISGVAAVWSEKRQQHVATKPIHALLRYSTEKHRFVVISADPEIYIQEQDRQP